MVEPFSPEFREALKKSHKDLTDEVIDGIQELVHRRFHINIERERAPIDVLDAERKRLMDEHAPKWMEVSKKFQERRRRRR